MHNQSKHISTPIAFDFQRRMYGPDSTEEEIKAIRGQVYFITPDVICLKELPVASPFSISLCFEKVKELYGDNQDVSLIIDLRYSSVANAESRRILFKDFLPLIKKMNFVVFCTGFNTFFNTVIRFVTFGIKSNSFSIENSIEDSLNKIAAKNYVSK